MSLRVLNVNSCVLGRRSPRSWRAPTYGVSTWPPSSVPARSSSSSRSPSTFFWEIQSQPVACLWRCHCTLPSDSPLLSSSLTPSRRCSRAASASAGFRFGDCHFIFELKGSRKWPALKNVMHFKVAVASAAVKKALSCLTRVCSYSDFRDARRSFTLRSFIHPSPQPSLMLYFIFIYIWNWKVYIIFPFH